jgi:zinc protease
LRLKNIEKLNRKTPPPIHEVTTLTLPTPSISKLDNGIPVYETRLGTQEVMKLEIVFLAGRQQEHKNIVSRATARELREGTKSFTSAQLAEKVDFYAGTLQSPSNLDTGGLVMYCMTKHFPKLIPIFAEMVLEPVFPEIELTTFVENNIQNLAVELTKNDVLAYRKITELMYGAAHPYGYNSTPEFYRALTTDDLHLHYKECYTSDNCMIFISGKTDASILTLLNQYLGQHKTVAVKKKHPLSIENILPQKAKVHNPDTLQSSLRIGRRIGTRMNPDFNGLFVLNTILGGYFGSRLMTNLREDKGYTYGIYSATDMMHQDGYFYIASDVGNDFVGKTLKEIYKETAILQNDLVKADELKMVQNYLLGNMLNMVDGAFPVSELVKTFNTEGVPDSHFYELIETIKHITPTELRDLAQKYLSKEDMFEVIAGV